MKSKLIILSVVVLVFSAGQVFAEEGHDHGEHSEEVSNEEKSSMMEHKGSMMEEHHAELPNVGNKICPVSGELISKVGDGTGVQVEHDGKIYNLCCNMCAKDFKKNPEKFIKIAEDEVEASKQEEEHEDEEHGEKGSHHEEEDHGDDDSKEGHEHGGHDH